MTLRLKIEEDVYFTIHEYQLVGELYPPLHVEFHIVVPLPPADPFYKLVKPYFVHDNSFFIIVEGAIINDVLQPTIILRDLSLTEYRMGQNYKEKWHAKFEGYSDIINSVSAEYLKKAPII